MDLASVEKIGAPIAKLVWDAVIHPELLKLEGTIGNAAIMAIVAALDPIINVQVDLELDKLAKG